jgi:hypothetical protein
MEILQTIGICVGATALAAIAVMLFLIMMTFAPVTRPIDDLPPIPPAPKKRSKSKAPPSTGEE